MIQVSHLTKMFGKIRAVNDVSFSVAQGEAFALLGPNGSGKSTTLKCLAGLVAPSQGEIRVNGVDLLRDPQRAKSFLSYLPQRIEFHDSLTAREVMEFYCRLRKLPLSRIDNLLCGSRFDFDGFADRRIGEFSGGMLQRLGLAIACLPDAPVLVLDESTVGLDPAGVVQFREFLTELKRKGKTIIFATHVLNDVEQLADRIAVFVEGRLIALETISAMRGKWIENDRRLSMEEIYLRYLQ